MQSSPSSDPLFSDLLKEIEKISGENLSECYQCGKCSAGCPIAFEMDQLPNQIIRLLQLGLVEEALQSRTIWLCASCETCSTRCPREVDLAAIMDALRILAVREGAPRPEKAMPLFNHIFLDLIRKYGRIFEGELVGRFNLGTLQPLKDIFKAPKLITRGKMPFFPSIVDAAKLKKIFKKIKELRKKRGEDQ